MDERRREQGVITSQHSAAVGDTIEEAARKVGQRGRHGTILEVLGDEDRRHFRVRWDDGHESTYFPGSDAKIDHPDPRERTMHRSGHSPLG